VDETLHEIQAGVDEVKAKRVVIDSLTGLEIALAPSFEEDFRESLYRLLGTLTGAGVSIMMTVENNDNYTELRFSPHAVSFMTNDIILQRYVEIDSQLKRVVTVIKTRSRKHSSDLRTYEITERGIGNGMSIIIFAAVVSRLPYQLGNVFTQGSKLQFAVIVAIAIELLHPLEIALGDSDHRSLGVGQVQILPGNFVH